jgi:pyruvate/2-oxoglutarate dehydrogenase complex dihydrolipoamide acyltransferase (E2) component
VIEIKLPATAWDGAHDGIEALLDKWQVTEQTAVTKGLVLATVVLVKASIDIEAPENGWVETIRVKEGDSFASGAVLATFKATS